MFSTRTSYKCKFNCVRLNLIWYHCILNLEIRAWNLYFLNENVLHLNNKNKPCFLMRIIDFCHPKLQRFCLSILKSVHFPLQKYHVPTNWQPCQCRGTFLRCFIFAIWMGSHMYIFKTERGNKRVQAGTELWRAALSRKAADFSIVLQGKWPKYSLKSFFKPW